MLAEIPLVLRQQHDIAPSGESSLLLGPSSAMPTAASISAGCLPAFVQMLRSIASFRLAVVRVRQHLLLLRCSNCVWPCRVW